MPPAPCFRSLTVLPAWFLLCSLRENVIIAVSWHRSPISWLAVVSSHTCDEHLSTPRTTVRFRNDASHWLFATAPGRRLSPENAMPWPAPPLVPRRQKSAPASLPTGSRVSAALLSRDAGNPRASLGALGWWKSLPIDEIFLDVKWLNGTSREWRMPRGKCNFSEASGIHRTQPWEGGTAGIAFAKLVR